MPTHVTADAKQDALEREWDERAASIFDAYQLDVVPMNQNVLVRVLPKDQMHGSLYLPDSRRDVGSQNKPVYEGVVLRTWEKTRVLKDFHEYELESMLSPGEHVLFMHYAGQPCEGLDAERYRLINEADVLGVLGYRREIPSPEDFIAGRLYQTKAWRVGTCESIAADLVAELSKHYDMVPRPKSCRTLSGS